MNGAVDFSNPYCVLKTNSEYEGHGVVRGLVPHLLLILETYYFSDFHHWPRQ